MEKKQAGGAPEIVAILSTVPPALSEVLAKNLLEKELAACVNILPVRSLYRWKGEVCDDGEHLLVIKTRRRLAEAVIRELRARHPYEVPEIIVLPVIAGHVPYLDWVHGETPRTMIQLHHAIQVTAGAAREVEDAVVVEDRFELLLNDQPVTEMVASRDQLRELGAGYLVSEGILRCVDNVKIDADRILVYSDTGCDLRWKKREVGSSGGLSFISAPPVVVSDIRLSPEDVSAVTREIETDLWKQTGGVHCSVLFSNGRLLKKSSDVGRHNTVDKLVGYAILNGIDLSRCVIGCTGRQPAGMVRKSAHAGIPVIISRAATTDKGIAAAEAAGITLIGFSRGERFTIYTHPERVVGIPVSRDAGVV